LSPAAEQALLNYPWPGNIRELRNTLERASLLTDGRSITLEHLFERPAPKHSEAQSMNSTLRDYLNECERDYILCALEACAWQIGSCADTLGISRKNLWEKMRRLGIARDEGDAPAQTGK
jgi:DNA-binding NtrC family response regulator